MAALLDVASSSFGLGLYLRSRLFKLKNSFSIVLQLQIYKSFVFPLENIVTKTFKSLVLECVGIKLQYIKIPP